MSADLKGLTTERRVVKASLTRFRNSLSAVDASTELPVLEQRKQRLDELSKQFTKVQTAIDNLAEDERIDEKEWATFESQRTEGADLIARYLYAARARESTLANNSNTNLSNPSPTPSSLEPPRLLPKIQIPPFDGNYAEWHRFHDTFRDLVHNNPGIPAVHKFHLLRSYLRGDAASITNSVNASEENYTAVWNRLQKRYSQPRNIIISHIKALFELSPVSRDSTAQLRALAERAEMHIEALKSLKQPVEWDEMLIYIITAKLDKQTRIDWDRTIEEGIMPTFSQLIEFLYQRARDSQPVELVTTTSDKRANRASDNRPKGQVRAQQSYLTTQTPNECPNCKGDHSLYACNDFQRLDAQERLKSVQKLNLCVNCLRSGHKTSECYSISCRKCNKRHHTLLHFDRAVTNTVANVASTSNDETPVVNLTSHADSEVLLSTASIYFIDRENRPHKCRVLLDGGSQANFIAQRFSKLLALPKQKVNIPATGLGASSTPISHSVQAVIRARNGGFCSKETFLEIPEITAFLPSTPVARHTLQIPKNIVLADPEFHRPAAIDALLGENLFYKLLCVGQIRLAGDRTILQKTQLGWVVSGRVKTHIEPTKPVRCHTINIALQDQLAKFWELEELAPQKHYSREEQICETTFEKTTCRDPSGRYVVRLPFNKNLDLLGDSFENAVKRFYSLERRLARDPNLYSQYRQFLKEYAQLGHMVEITDSSSPTKGYYLPHHPVIKSNSLTTKVRVVFDASAKTTTNISLNDCLLAGPTIQDDIFTLLTRFRSYRYVLTADIEKMFRQIQLHEEDSEYQKIVWRERPTDQLRTYRLNTVTYGTASAPYLAVRCLQQLANDEGDKFPLAARAFKRDFYVDDLLTGASTLSQAKALREELVKLARTGGFVLRQWSSNEPSLIQELHNSTTADHLYIDANSNKKTLGVYWDAIKDTINYSINISHDKKHVTKRNILSQIAQLYDPLGMLGPVIITAKIMMQQLWKGNFHWDESLPMHIQEDWIKYKQELPLLNEFSLPRQIIIENSKNIQLHGFCDASQIAYGACIYLRSHDENNATCRLVCAKSRVAPLKTASLPRLELCAAVLLAKLYKAVMASLEITIDTIRCWTDSTIVLHWLNTPPHKLKTFVANRVAYLQGTLPAQGWAHVPTAENPADALSRGQPVAKFLENSLWVNGPQWLAQAESTWPRLTLPTIEVPEIRIAVHCVDTSTNALEILTRFSRFRTLQRVIAYCLRFKRKALNKERLAAPLTIPELEQAHICVIKLVQGQAFTREIKNLGAQQPVHATSKLVQFNPFLDKHGVIRVGGRLGNSALNFSQKHPIVLPRHSVVTNLLIRQQHEKYLHAGVQATLNAVRQEYWPIDGRATVKGCIRKCITCFRANPTSRIVKYPMGNLPASRVTPSQPFVVVGVDYCGPLFVKEKRHRNTKQLKVYVAVFTCFSTKAIHLELVSDLTADAFLAALRRFISRRGLPSDIYSDNGTNFVGAKRQVDEIQQIMSSTALNETVSRYLTELKVNWHFSPPRAPHFGGLWEAAVKSFKHHLIRTVGNTVLTYELLNTFIAQIEAVLNSRPLTPLSTDPNDLSVLTPAHFLIGRSLMTIPEIDLSEISDNRLSSYQHISKLRQHFWKRWHKEYINELTIRRKWHNPQTDTVKIGSLVVMKDDNLPAMRWALGRIVETHPGSDGVIRVVKVKTSNQTLSRSVKHIYPLPIE